MKHYTTSVKKLTDIYSMFVNDENFKALLIPDDKTEMSKDEFYKIVLSIAIKRCPKEADLSNLEKAIKALQNRYPNWDKKSKVVTKSIAPAVKNS